MYIFMKLDLVLINKEVIPFMVSITYHITKRIIRIIISDMSNFIFLNIILSVGCILNGSCYHFILFSTGHAMAGEPVTLQM